MRFLPLILLLIAGCASHPTQAQTAVILKQPSAAQYRSVVCYATYWDDSGVTPKGACRFTGVASGSGRGGGYVKPPLTWYAANWDLFGNINVGLQCAHRDKYVSAPPPVVYSNGYYEAICNTDLTYQGEAFDLLPGITTPYWIGPSIAGEYVIAGQSVYLP